MSPKLSIITAVRNDPQGLARTIASVREEAPGAEHVIVDGSDQPVDINGLNPMLRRTTGRDRGISHAFNRGILAATGEYVLFVNAGDSFVPGAGALVTRALESTSAECVWFSVFRHGDEGEPYLYKPRMRWLKYGMSAPHQGMIVKRDVFAEIGLFPIQRYAMDHHLALRLISRTPEYRVECKPDPIAYYPVGGHSTQGGVRPFLANCGNVARLRPRSLPGALLANAYLAVKSMLA